jgi:F-type H+-transporting ATPase subunit b
MLINWFTVFAQAINFLILVWLLKRFLYKPILQAIDERERAIAAQLADAEAKKAVAQKERDDFQHKNETFDKERASLLKKAKDEADVERQRLLGEARKDADALRAKRQEALRTEQRNLGQEITRWARKEVFAVTRRTLADLAGASLEERVCDVFVQRVRALAGEAKEQMVNAFKTSNHTVSVHSAFDMPPAQQSSIDGAVKKVFGPDAHVQFETAPELVSGIELTTNGHKIAWSIADYLATLERSAGELLQKDPEPESKPGEKSEPESNAEVKPEPKAEAKPEPKAEAKPVPKAEAKNGPKAEARLGTKHGPQQEPEPVAAAPKAVH